MAEDPRAAADEMYRAAYLDLTRGNYELATQGLQNYLVKYPTGAHVSEVHYYLGECYYARDRHLEAVSEFQYVVREFPASRLAPAAFLKSGYCYRELEERSLAEKAFRALIDQHPETEEAKQARAALDELEG
jgi:tol-pal system protein YbgF